MTPPRSGPDSADACAARQGGPPASASRGRRWKWLAWGVPVAGLLLFVAAWYLLPVDRWMEALHRWVGGMGAWSPVVFGMLYVAGVLLLMPGSAMALAAGLIFGLWGAPIALVAATIGASLTFLIGRHLAQDRIRALLENRRRAKAVLCAIDRGGFRIAVLIRLSPLIPFNLQNYLFGVTELRLRDYMAATFVGIIPGTLLKVYLGTLGRMAADADSESLEWAGLGFGLAASIVVAWLLTRKAKQALAEAGAGEGTSSGSEPDDRRERKA